MSNFSIPLLPLRDVVVYPAMVVPLFVGRDKSILALEAALEADKQILLLAQKDGAADDPGADDLYTVGSIANILQLLRLPDGTVKVLVEGSTRAEVTDLDESRGYFTATAVTYPAEAARPEDKNMIKALVEQFQVYVQSSRNIPDEVLSSLNGIDDLGRVIDTIAAHMTASVQQKQKVLELTDTATRAEHIMQIIESELDLLVVEKKLRGRVKKQMEKSQREYYLNEQIKAIQKELGRNGRRTQRN